MELLTENENLKVEIERLLRQQETKQIAMLVQQQKAMQMTMDMQLQEIAMLKAERKKFRQMLRQNDIDLPSNTSE